MMPNVNQQGQLSPDMPAEFQDPAFTQWFKTLTPEDQQATLQRLSTDYKGQNAALSDQMAAAEALRDTPSAEGRQAGRVYVAANPLEHIASAYQQRQGADQLAEALRKKKELSDMYGQGISDVMGANLRY